MNDMTSFKSSDWIFERSAKQKLCYSRSGAAIIPPEDISIGRNLNLDMNDRLDGNGRYASVSSDVPGIVTVSQPVIIDNDDSYLEYWAEIMDEAEKDLFSSLDWDCLQIGEPVEMERIITDLISRTTPVNVMNWLNSLFLEHSSDVLFLCTVLHALSHIEYEVIYPVAPMFVVASLLHDDDRVVYYAIKTFSNWNSKESLKYASEFCPQQDWARKKWYEVKDYIQEHGDDISVVSDPTDYLRPLDTASA